MSFWQRHRKKFITFGVVSAVGAGGLYLLNKYVDHRIAQQKEEEDQRKFKQYQKQQQFENTLNIAGQTNKNALFPALKRIIGETLKTSDILLELKTNSSNLELWKELKSLVLGKSLAIVICGTFVDFLVKIQLNILAGYNVNNNNPISTQTQEHFLSLCQLFISKQVEKWTKDELMPNVTQTMENVELTQKYDLTLLQALLMEILSEMKFGDNLPEFLLPINELPWSSMSSTESTHLKTLIAETMDVLEHKDFFTVLQKCFVSSCNEFLDKLAESMPSTDLLNQTNLPLAKLIPKLDKTFQALSEPLPSNPQMQLFVANVFETFCNSS